jgi:hypothetical protein
VLTLPILLALLAPPGDLRARQATAGSGVDGSIERCPEFRDEAGGVRVIECVFLDSGELAVLDGDVYLYGRYCLDVANLPIPPCAVGRGNQAAAVFVRRRGATETGHHHRRDRRTDSASVDRGEPVWPCSRVANHPVGHLRLQRQPVLSEARRVTPMA